MSAAAAAAAVMTRDLPADADVEAKDPDCVVAVCTAPVNIAVIKYWGKRDEKLILPINSSLSGTIDQGNAHRSFVRSFGSGSVCWCVRAEMRISSNVGCILLQTVVTRKTIFFVSSVGSMRSYTKIVASKRLQRDCMFLNGKEEDVTKSHRITTVIKQLRALAQDRKYTAAAPSSKSVEVKAADWSNYHLKIISDNNFPTAAGLASSASGFACLTK